VKRFLLALLVACNADRDPAVHTLTLPPEEATALADGPGRSAVLSRCGACHSMRYIAGQPRLSRKGWQAEVDKMKNVYGAPVTDADAPLIVDYLVAANGTE
jgi:cytochrome c553